MKPSTKYSPEVRERAVWLVLAHQGEHDSQWSAIVSVSSKLGCTSETLRKWVRQAERDRLTNGSHLARWALEYGDVRLDDIPDRVALR